MCISPEPGYISIYIWPKGHDAEEDLPEDFYKILGEKLASVGLEWENI